MAVCETRLLRIARKRIMQFLMHRARASGFGRRIPRWARCLKVDAFLRASWFVPRASEAAMPAKVDFTI